MDDYLARLDRAEKAAAKFGSNMVMLARRQHISHGELAKMVGANAGTVSAWHVGRSTPGLVNALMVCDALGVNIGDMVTKGYCYEFGYKK